MQIDTKRRLLLKGGALLAVLAALPRALLAAAWPREAFSATEAAGALQALLGTDQSTPSDQIDLKLPEIAENGAVVPVTVSTSLPGVESISIVVAKNPRPLAASFEIPPGTLPEVASRIKMAQTSEVTAVIKTAGGIFSAAKVVKVTIGGCGG